MPRPNKRKRQHQNIRHKKSRLDDETIYDNSSDLVNDFVEQIYLNGLHISSGWNFSENVPQKMNFGEDHPGVKLRGQPKGVRQILIQRSL